MESKFPQKFSYFLTRNNNWSVIQYQNANSLFNSRTIINRGDFSVNKEIIYPRNEVLHNFSNGPGDWEGKGLETNPSQSTEFIVKSTNSLKAGISYIGPKQYSLLTRKPLPFNIIGRRQLTVYTRLAAWTSQNYGKMTAKFYLSTGARGWRDEGESEVRSNATTVLSLNLCKSSAEELNDIEEIGVFYQSSGEGGRSAIYLSSVFVE